MLYRFGETAIEPIEDDYYADIPAKFRARRKDTGEFVFSETYSNVKFSIKDADGHYYDVEIIPSTVTGLVGYDKDGKEIYCNDKVTNDELCISFIVDVCNAPDFDLSEYRRID